MYGTPSAPGPLRPRIGSTVLNLKRRKNSHVKAKPHLAELVRDVFRCPACGPLGGVTEAIEHCVANQYTVAEEDR